MKDVMIDFETLGNGKDKCICQVGAVFFNNITGELGAEFKANIDAATHAAVGGKLDADTVYWWLAQSRAAQDSILGPKVSILEAMTSLNEFLAPAARVWSHATFDFVTLMETFKQLNLKPTVSYKQGLDLRTLCYLAGTSVSDFTREGVHHDGLEDAKHQVKYCVSSLNAVKNNKQLIKFVKKMVDV
jgi:hypothetical protein